MRPVRLALLLALVAAQMPLLARVLRADSLPIIVTYELKKQRQEARLSARDPKAFWLHQIVSRLESKRPVLAKPPKEAVTARVTFVVARDGHVVSKTISQSSGNEEADKTAMAMVENAQPFPPMPAAMDGRDLIFTLPVRFR